jgi:hypothetical protein
VSSFIRRLGVFLLISIALSMPRDAYGHASEFILAKVIPEKGRVRVEITVDCTGNPMIRSEAEARAVVEKALHIHAGGQTKLLSEIGPFRYERRTSIDPETPIPQDPEDLARPHQIVCAHWAWENPPSPVAFQNSKDSAQNVILWMPAASPGEKPRWSMLVAGDTSPEITIQPGSRSQLKYAAAIIASAGIAGFLTLRRFFPRSRS